MGAREAKEGAAPGRFASAPGVDRLRDNPFYVLGVRPAASRAELEREGQKLLGMLELGLTSARTYATPVGPGERTTDKVRAAMAELRDPERRLGHELWASLETRVEAARDPEDEGDSVEPEVCDRADGPWPEALRALGWRPRR